MPETALLDQKLILPRLAHTYGARHALQTHQRGLLDRLHMSAGALKESQRSAFDVLPQPDRFREEPRFASCNTIEELLEVAKPDDMATFRLPVVSVLRAALHELTTEEKRAPTTEELFSFLEKKIPILAPKEGAAYLVRYRCISSARYYP
jgi:hypothetical protein